MQSLQFAVWLLHALLWAMQPWKNMLLTRAGHTIFKTTSFQVRNTTHVTTRLSLQTAINPLSSVKFQNTPVSIVWSVEKDSLSSDSEILAQKLCLLKEALMCYEFSSRDLVQIFVLCLILIIRTPQRNKFWSPWGSKLAWSPRLEIFFDI